MTNFEQKVKTRREEFHNKLPRIQLNTCKIEKSTDTNVRRLIIEGSPTLLGAVLPNAEIGGLTPLKLMASTDGKVAAGLLKGSLKTRNAIIDYGFTKDECQIEEVYFSSKDNEIFNQITQVPIRMKTRNRFLRKVTNALAWVLWKIKIA